MNQKIIIGVGYGGYTFDASLKKVTVSGITTVTLEQFLLIVNLTRDKVIYNPTCENIGGILSGNDLTLDFDTTAYDDSDILQIHFALNSDTDILPVPVTIDGGTIATETTLQSVLTAVQNIAIDADSVNLNTDSLETLIGTTNTTLSSIDTKLDSPITVDGTVELGATSLAALENINVTVTSIGEVEIKNDAGNPVPISDAGGSITIDATSLPLPTGAATSANQTMANASLSSIDTKLTSPLTVSVNNFPASTEISNDVGNPVPVNGTVELGATSLSALEIITVQNGSGASAVNIQDGGNSITVDGTVTANISASTTLPPVGAGIGTYTDNDKVFSFSIDLQAATSGINNPLITLNNPLASGKEFFVEAFYGGTSVANVSMKYKIFANPTITAAGTLQTARNNKVGSVVASTAVVRTLPTVSASGQELRSIQNGQNSNSVVISNLGSIVLQPNNTLLITADPLSNNRQAVLTLIWIEI